MHFVVEENIIFLLNNIINNKNIKIILNNTTYYNYSKENHVSIKLKI